MSFSLRVPFSQKKTNNYTQKCTLGESYQSFGKSYVQWCPEVFQKPVRLYFSISLSTTRGVFSFFLKRESAVDTLQNRKEMLSYLYLINHNFFLFIFRGIRDPGLHTRKYDTGHKLKKKKKNRVCRNS